MNPVMLFRPSSIDHWLRLHWYSHQPGVGVAIECVRDGVLVHGHIVACHPEIMAFTILLH